MNDSVSHLITLLENTKAEWGDLPVTVRPYGKSEEEEIACLEFHDDRIVISTWIPPRARRKIAN